MSKSPADYELHWRGDGRRFHVRIYPGGLWEVYGCSVDHICVCKDQATAEMVAEALEQAAMRLDFAEEAKAWIDQAVAETERKDPSP